jgi:hypothetical protein
MVTAVSGSTITVSTTSPSGGSSTGKITVDGSTTFTIAKPATTAALVVNQCVAAAGKSDSSGNFAATTLAVTTPGANGCVQRGRPGGAGN